MVAMGISLHVGQIVLLVKNGVLEGYEVARQEVFIGLATLFLGILVYLRMGAWQGSVLGLGLVGILAWAVVLRSGDTRTLGMWLRRRLL
jgi:hypothetical protein